MASVLSSGEIEQLFQNDDTTSVSINRYPSLIPIINVLQNRNNEKSIIAYLNKQLTKPSNYDVGFKYLNALLASCSMETLSENAVTWINYAVASQKALLSPRFTFLSNIMLLCRNNQDFNKIMTSTYLPKVVEVCISIPVTKSQPVAVLRCLKNCLEIYSSSCGPMKNKIEGYLLNILNLDLYDSLVMEAGKCFHFLQQVGGGGPESVNHINNWSTAVKRLCRTKHTLYDKLFENTAELKRYDSVNVLPHAFPEHSCNAGSISLLTITERRLNNVGLFLRAMLETKYHVTKVINPQHLLNLFERCLSLHSCVIMERSHSLEVSHFSALLMKQQIRIFYLLRSFIAMLHLNLIPFSAIITKMLLDSLVRTNNCNCFCNDSDYKDSLYKVLIYWIQMMKNNLNDNLYNKIISEIISDIKPLKTEVSLSMTNVQNQGESQKTKKKTIESRILASAAGSDKRDYSECYLAVRRQVSCKALKCLVCIFRNVHVNVKQATLKNVYLTVMESLIKIQSGMTIVPYMGEETQVMLYEALLAITSLSIFIIPPPVELALNIFLEGQRSNNFKISQICSNGLKTLELMCQPICPPLHITNELLEVESNEDSEQISCAGSGSVEMEANEPSVPIANDYESEDNTNKEIVQNAQIETECDIKCSPISALDTSLSISNDCEDTPFEESMLLKNSPKSAHNENMDNEVLPLTPINTELDIKTSPMRATIIVNFDSSGEIEHENLDTSTSDLSTNLEGANDKVQSKRKSSKEDELLYIAMASTPTEQPLAKKTKLKDPLAVDMMDSFVDVINEY